jgi:hypothetical protein
VAAALPTLADPRLSDVAPVTRSAPVTPRTAVALAGVLAVALVPAGCGTSPAPPSTPAPVLGIDWGRVPVVERPHVYEETVAPSYAAAHPILRIAGQAMMTDLIDLPGGGFTAVGYVPPDWHPTAWASVDGGTWSLRPMESTPFTFPMALARAAAGPIVAVGRSGATPVAWTTQDGSTWTRRDVPVLGSDGVAERMTSIAWSAVGGFVAGGSAGPELFDRQARLWTSADGSAWTPVPDDAAVFSDAEVRGITAVDGGYVAVGVVGTVQDPTGAVAWTSSDGQTWERVEGAPFAGGIAVAVATAPFGGLVAVGSDLDRREAVAWISPDGRSWTRAPREDARTHPGGYAWMTDVAAIGNVMVGIGVVQGLQRGTAVAWVSSDGLHWTRSRSAPVQEGAEFYAILAGGPGALAVGAFGAPDSYVPDVWQSPAR